MSTDLYMTVCSKKKMSFFSFFWSNEQLSKIFEWYKGDSLAQNLPVEGAAE